MKNDYTGTIRGYFRTSKAWYAQSYAATGTPLRVSFGMYAPDGGTLGDMSMVWVQIGNELVPQLQCFDDAWEALSLFSDLLQKMAEVNDACITEAQFVEMLDSCGFRDLTKYEER